MPFYDYVCQACGRRIEVMHGVHATGPARCDACGGQMQRVISRPAIHFKGSGWAKKDARAHTGAATGGREHRTTGSEKDQGTTRGDTKGRPDAGAGAADAPAARADVAAPAAGGAGPTGPTGQEEA